MQRRSAIKLHLSRYACRPGRIRQRPAFPNRQFAGLLPAAVLQPRAERTADRPDRDRSFRPTTIPVARSEANVILFIDLMSPTATGRCRNIGQSGLAAFDAEAQRRFNMPFAEARCCGQQHEIMSFAARNETSSGRPSELDLFFRTLKLMTLNGYYTSATGIHRDLQYKGNTALPNYYGCTHPEHQA